MQYCKKLYSTAYNCTMHTLYPRATHTRYFLALVIYITALHCTSLHSYIKDGLIMPRILLYSEHNDSRTAGPGSAASFALYRLEQTFHHHLTKMVKSIVPSRSDWHFWQSGLRGIVNYRSLSAGDETLDILWVGRRFTCIRLNNLCTSNIKGMSFQHCRMNQWHKCQWQQCFP